LRLVPAVGPLTFITPPDRLSSTLPVRMSAAPSLLEVELKEYRVLSLLFVLKCQSSATAVGEFSLDDLRLPTFANLTDRSSCLPPVPNAAGSNL